MTFFFRRTTAALVFTAALSTLSILSATAPAQAQPLPAVSDAPYPGVITLQVDATDLTRKIFRVRETVPVQPGPLVLLYPRWLPGNHGPTGNVSQLAGLQISAQGKPLEWTRNTLDTHAFHVQVPPGVSTLELEFEFLSHLSSANGRVVMSPEILGLQWNSVLLYPAGHAASKIQVKPSLTLPEGWRQGSALRAETERNGTITFAPVDVDTLVDSPVFAGRHFQRYDLDPEAAKAGRPPVFLNVVSDEARQAVANDEQIAAHRALVTQADRVFASRHFTRYDFLLSTSSSFSGIGLEHHQSSENGVKPGYFTDWSKNSIGRTLLPHEYAHSWNGKFRRPADLWTPHFNTPMQNSLLWVYEGQTQYWGFVLAGRSGLLKPDELRDDLADTAAYLDARAGRAWRNLQDTTNEPIISARRAPQDWRDWQRSADYYDESLLIWLEADMLIRERSQGRRSLDDFARSFFGASPKQVEPLLYRFDDVVAALNRVQAHDWASFLRQRLDRHEGSALLAGLNAAGWTLAWSDKASERQKQRETDGEYTDFSYSLGLSVGRDGRLSRVAWNSPAFKAGLAPGVTLLAVNGRGYKAEGLRDAITAAKDGGPLELLVKDGDRYRTVKVDWRGGLRYPVLQRVAGTPDRLAELLKPLP